MSKSNNELRPKKINEFIGQKDNIKKLRVYIQAANSRDECLDHVIIYGPPGLGKTTIAQIIANELNANIKYVLAPSIEKIADIISILTSIDIGDVVFIDEIHRLSPVIEETIYTALEDYYIDIMSGSQGDKKSIRINLPPFTLVGATTKLGMLSAPLRDRFGVTIKLQYYSISELCEIIIRTCNIYGIGYDYNSIKLISSCSRSTPRIALKLLKRVRDFAQVENNNFISLSIVNKTLDTMNIYKNGLEKIDIDYLLCLIKNKTDSGTGIKNISKIIGEDENTLIESVEPYILYLEYAKITGRGRVITQKGIKYIENIKDKLLIANK